MPILMASRKLTHPTLGKGTRNKNIFNKMTFLGDIVSSQEGYVDKCVVQSKNMLFFNVFLHVYFSEVGQQNQFGMDNL